MDFSKNYKGPVAPGDILVGDGGDSIGYVDNSGQIVLNNNNAPAFNEQYYNEGFSGGSGFDSSNPLGVATQSNSFDFAGPASAPVPPRPISTGGALEDGAYGVDIANIEGALQRRLSQFEADRTGLETNFASQMRDASTRLPKDLMQSTEAASGRGMLRSGGYLEDQGSINKNFGDFTSGLATDKTRRMNDMQRLLAEDRTGFDNQRQAALTSAAERRVQRAAAENAANAQLPQPGPVQLSPAAGRPSGSGGSAGGTSQPSGVLGNGNDPGARPNPTAPMPPYTPPKPQTQVNPFTGPMQGAAPVGYTGASNQPKAPVTAVKAGPAGARAVASFDAKSQQILRSGGTVTGGDGRKFKLVNGVAAYIGV